MLRLSEKTAHSPYAFEKDMASDPMVKMIVLIHVKWNKVKVKGKINRTSTTKHQPGKYVASIIRGTRGSVRVNPKIYSRMADQQNTSSPEAIYKMY